MPYLLPSHIPPPGFRCIKIWIPDDPEWSAVFWGQFHQLAHWWTHERDGAQSAAAVAMVWREVWEMSREAYENSDGCSTEGEDMTKIRYRPKPGQPYITQFKYDDESTWADMIIQPHWESIVTPPIEDDTAAKDAAGAIIRGWHEWLAGHIITDIADGKTQLETVDAIMGQLGSYTTQPDTTREAINEVYDAVASLPTPTADPYETDCPYGDFWDRLADWIGEQGADWLHNMSDALNSTLNNAEDELVDTLNNAAATLAGDKLNNWAVGHAGGGGGTEFGAACTWEHIFDFRDGQFGWEAVISGNPAIPIGQWVDGTGFTDDGPDEGGCAVAVHIKREDTGDPIVFTDMDFYVSMQASPDNGMGAGTLDPACGGSHAGGDTAFSWQLFHLNDYDCQQLATGLGFEIFNTTCHGITIQQARIKGLGFDPFE